MVEVVVVSVDTINNIYYLSPNSIELNKDDFVIFESDNIKHFGKVIRQNYQEKTKNENLKLIKKKELWLKEELAKRNMPINSIDYAYYKNNSVYFINNP